MDTDVLGTSGVVAQTGEISRDIPAPVSFARGCFSQIAPSCCASSPLKKTRFTTLIINNRVLPLNYLRKLTRPLKDVLSPSYVYPKLQPDPDI